MTNKVLPKPSCALGYTRDDLETIFPYTLSHFDKWMVGQTVSVCDGRSYNHQLARYEETDCGPHGAVVYPWDVQRYVDGLPIID